MATTHGYEEADDRGAGTRHARSRTGSATSKGATAGLSTAALLDIVERLGLVDMVVDRVKERLNDINIDELIDDAVDYVRRNPEVLVVALGAVTIASGALVYLAKRNERRWGAGETTTTTAAAHKATGGAARSRKRSS